jgi:hypothetical protein
MWLDDARRSGEHQGLNPHIEVAGFYGSEDNNVSIEGGSHHPRQ